MRGAPEQLTLMPTTSLGVMKRAQASSSRASPVRPSCRGDHLLDEFAIDLVPSRVDGFSEWTRTTWPGYGPGMPGLAAGLKGRHHCYRPGRHGPREQRRGGGDLEEESSIHGGECIVR